MTIAANDVNVISVETDDLNFPVNTNIIVTVEAEAGSALFATGGSYLVKMTMTDTTSPQLVYQQQIPGNYSDPNWPTPVSTFTFTVPGAATATLVGDLLEPQARVIGNAVAPFDASFTVGQRILLTP